MDMSKSREENSGSYLTPKSKEKNYILHKVVFCIVIYAMRIKHIKQVYH